MDPAKKAKMWKKAHIVFLAAEIVIVYVIMWGSHSQEWMEETYPLVSALAVTLGLEKLRINVFERREDDA